MAESIRKKFFSGLAWTFVQSVAVRVISVVVTIILARLLMPEDYGLIGMLSIFIAISDVFIQSGFGQALIQKTDCTDEDFSTAFYFNVAVSVLIYIILFFFAPLIADFYHEPNLVLLTRILSLNFILGSFNVVQHSKLKKELNFKPLAIITLLCTVISGVVGIAMAYSGFGVWACSSVGYDSKLEDGVEVIGRNDYNAQEVAEKLSSLIARYSAFDKKTIDKVRRNAAKLAEKALWKNFIKYYYEAYDIALRNAKARK